MSNQHEYFSLAWEKLYDNDLSISNLQGIQDGVSKLVDLNLVACIRQSRFDNHRESPDYWIDYRKGSERFSECKLERLVLPKKWPEPGYRMTQGLEIECMV